MPPLPKSALALLLLCGGASPWVQARILQPDVPPPLPKLAAQPRQDQPRITETTENADVWVKRLQAQASAKNAAASWELGLLYFHGVGLNASPARAQELFTQAYRGGEQRAAAGLAVCSMQACSGPPDAAAARRWTAPSWRWAGGGACCCCRSISMRRARGPAYGVRCCG